MNAARRALTLLAAAAAAAALFFAMRSPDEVAPPAPPGHAAPALSLTLPPATPASGTAGSAATPPTAAPPSPPPVGSEGYGPHIERAQAGDDPQTAWQAVQWLRLCAANASRRTNLELNRDRGILPEVMTQLMVEADADGRRCQTVTAQHLALLPELAARAMRAGVPWAVFAYAESVSAGDLTSTQRQEVADAMRHDALTGDALNLVGAATAGEAWGLSDAERLKFLMAARLLYDLPGIDAVPPPPQPGDLHLASPPTPQQLAEARQAAQQLLDRAGVDRP